MNQQLETLGETIADLRTQLAKQLSKGLPARDLISQVKQAETEFDVLFSVQDDIEKFTQEQQAIRQAAAIAAAHKEANKLRHRTADVLAGYEEDFKRMVEELNQLSQEANHLSGIVYANGGGYTFTEIQARISTAKRELERLLKIFNHYKFGAFSSFGFKDE